MRTSGLFVLFVLLSAARGQDTPGQPFDAAPYGIAIENGRGLQWEDPREIHAVTVDFAEKVPAKLKLRLEYWGSHWPKEHLPKDREPGGGDNGWVELGNWYKGGWRVADAGQTVSGKSVTFTFRPVNEHEFPELKDYGSTGRFTLKFRIVGDEEIPKIVHIQTLTDSTLAERTARVAWKNSPASNFRAEAFNGEVISLKPAGKTSTLLRISTA